jgi:hypothetical protein
MRHTENQPIGTSSNLISQWEQRKVLCVVPTIFRMHTEQIRLRIE